MSLENTLIARSDSACELCGATEHLSIYAVPPVKEKTKDTCAYVCATCLHQIENPDSIQPDHWRCLNDSMWSPVPAVQVLAWRMLKQLESESWAQDLPGMLYLEDETLAWAEAGLSSEDNEDSVHHLDCNGTLLESGDTVTLIKDLNVKGANFTAKRGTVVRGISLVQDNAEQIEGKINGQQIVLRTEFVKKTT